MPAKKATSSKAVKKEKLPEVVPAIEPAITVEVVEDIQESEGAADESATEPLASSGLLARFPDGTVREPTHEELVEMGREIAKRLFSREPVEVAQLQNSDAPPPPKISGNHCRLCASFAGNDLRGALWSDEGLCLTYKHVQKPVLPENHCERFVFNEGLRG